MLIVFGCLFVITGMSGLLLEQVYEKLLSTVVGGSTPAGAIVLAVYFGGIALGGLIYGFLPARRREGFRLYGFLELVIGVWALLIWASFPWIQSGSGALMRLAGDSAFSIAAVRLIVSCLWILVPTVAMGMTFPCVVAGLQQIRVANVKRVMARFYSLNLLGAVFGAAAGPYLIFPRFGMSGTLLILAIVESMVFFTAWTISPGSWGAREADVLSGAKRHVARGLRAAIGTQQGALLLSLAFASGFLFFAFEVIWVHLIAVAIGSSVYAFAVMLTVVLMALFTGGYISSSIFSHSKTVPSVLLSLAIVASAWMLAQTFGAWDDAPLILGRWGAGLTAFQDGEILRFLVAAGLIGPAALFMGMIYPMLFRLPWFPEEQADIVAGAMGATNAIGSILGSLVTGFILLQQWGSESTYRVLTFACSLLGLAVAVREFMVRSQRSWTRLKLLTLIVLVVALHVSIKITQQQPWNLLHLTSGINVYFRPLHVRADSRMLFWHEDTYGGITTVVENQNDNARSTYVLLTNGKFQGNNSGEMPAQVCLALIPIIHQPVRNRALVIGLGTGNSAEVVEAAGYQSLDIAELSPGIAQAAKTLFSGVNRNLLARPNVHLFIEDGRNYLLRTDKVYDLITIEISSIWFAGSSNLYSRDFYSLVAKHLAPNGVFQQWIQFHHIGSGEVSSSIATLRSVFPFVTVWYAGGQGILVASRSPLRINADIIQDLKTRQSLARDRYLLENIYRIPLDHLADLMLLDESDTTRLFSASKSRGITINTDANRYLEYATPRYNLVRLSLNMEIIRSLLKYSDPGEAEKRLKSIRE